LLIADRLTRGGAAVDGWYYCPHHPESVVPGLAAPCACRKPGTAMPAAAAERLGLDLSRSWVVGDHWRDVQMGHAIGARSILVRTGHGRDQESRPPEGQCAEAICDNLMAAAAKILEHAARAAGTR
jgi:histidinol phosphatase-like enzyme